MLRFTFILSVLMLGLILGALPLRAEPLMGLWLTQPDGKGQVAHVQVRRCSGAFCGRIVEVRNSAGQPIAHKNTGKDLFWAMRPLGGGAYEGKGWVPKNNLRFDGQMQVKGNRLVLRGCAAGICRTLNWSRLR